MQKVITIDMIWVKRHKMQDEYDKKTKTCDRK